jgi:hypothetical protein
MSVILGVEICIFFLLDIISVVGEMLGRRTVSAHGAKAPNFAQRRRIWLHFGAYVLIIGGFWAIMHFGPLRPVHEWMR